MDIYHLRVEMLKWNVVLVKIIIFKVLIIFIIFVFGLKQYILNITKP